MSARKIGDLEPLSSLAPEERCSTCGQPDNSGDCDHAPLTDAELASLGFRR